MVSMSSSSTRSFSAILLKPDSVLANIAPVTHELHSNAQPFVVVSELTKHYGARVAVDKLSLRILPGQIYGLLGPNGAGKSTTVAMLSTYLAPTRGGATIGQFHLQDPAARAQIGMVPQELALYPYLTGEQNLRFFGRLYDLRGELLRQRCNEALEMAGLTGRRSDLVSSYSGGMQRRLNIAVAVLHNPKFLLLDEPMLSVDPQSRACLVEAVRELRRQGTTILYTTHHLEEAEELCDVVGILDRGRLIAEGTIEDLMSKAGVKRLARSDDTGLTAVFLQLTGRALRD